MSSSPAGAPKGVCAVWPENDLLRLVSLLQADGVGALASACSETRRQLQMRRLTERTPRIHVAKSPKNEKATLDALKAQVALSALESAITESGDKVGTSMNFDVTEAELLRQLEGFETTMLTEHGYCYGPDWEVKPGKLVAKKGTWFKSNTKFSWELNENEKFYLPTGIVVPILQIGRVTDPKEIQRHDWVSQHMRVWVKPQIVKILEARRGTWFVYYPHFEDHGSVLVANVDTWLKRTTQMSGELEPFEIIYVPKGLSIQLIGFAEPVEEEWEKSRHQHVHLHRKLLLAAPPVTIKQDKFEIFVGQGDARPSLNC